MSEKTDELVLVCRDFVRAMGKAEASLIQMGDELSDEEWSEGLQEVLYTTS